MNWPPASPLITDGAWGTELQRRGLPPGAVPDPWNLERPEDVFDVAKAYVDAGSQVILSNTFRANSVAMPGAAVEAINRAGVEISKRAADGHALVFASIGPSGKMLITGDVSPRGLRESFALQARALAEAGADALLIETMSDPEEAEIALLAAKETGLRVVVSFAFDSGKNKDRTMMGSTPEQVARRMEQAGADAIGANCGAGVESFAAVCQRLKSACGLPVWVKANAGLPSVSGGIITYYTTAAAFASHYWRLVDAGASFIGGCCGTSPEFIRALAAQRDACDIS